MHQIIIIILLSILTLGCSDKKDMVLSEDQLEDVLYDYHITDAILQRSEISSDKYGLYYDAILHKHSISRAQFDSSMVYYMKHADKIHTIYENISDRLSNEAKLQGLDGNSMFSGQLIKGDTANIWNLDNAKVFTSNENENIQKFNFVADTTYRKGDRFLFSFKSDFIYQDGARNGYAVMSIKFANDSVVTRSSSISSSSRYSIEINDDQEIGVKEIKGFIMQRKSNIITERNNQTLRMMIISEIKLIKMHKPKSQPSSIKNKDSISSINNNNNESINRNENKSTPIIHTPVDSMRGPRPGMHKLHSR